MTGNGLFVMLMKVIGLKQVHKMCDIILRTVDAVYLQVFSEDMGIIMELSEFFTFNVPGARFMPAFRNKMWDGKIRLFDFRSRRIYTGLLPYIRKFATERNYSVDETQIANNVDKEVDIEFGETFFKDLKPYAKDAGVLKPIEATDYQINAFIHAINNERCILLSPTASGKSLIIYGLLRYYQPLFQVNKLLVIVPTTSLVEQMYTDFEDYSHKDTEWRIEKNCHRIYSGKDKETDLPIVITTWQSIYKLPKSWFDQFTVVVGDEAHNFQAKSLTAIMTKMNNAPFRFGTTGTIQDTKTHRLVLEGLFGEVFKVTTTDELIRSGQISNIDIKCLILEYDQEICKLMKNATYRQEIEYLISHNRRNRFISNLVLSLERNTLVLFREVENHGVILHELIKNRVKDDRKVFFIHGKTDTDIREDVRRIVETQTDAIIVASYGVFSSGVNVRNIFNIIFASPSKSRIRNLQSIGRGLRKSETKNHLTLYDIADNLKYKGHKNLTLNHFLYRIKLYDEEKFNYKLFPIKLRT